MKEKKIKSSFIVPVCLLLLFIMYTVALRSIDVRTIGPENSSVGFATINQYIHERVGVNMTLYNITDVLGNIVILMMIGFAIIGLVQLVKRKSLKLVDKELLMLGFYYFLVLSFYLFFEIFIVNYRPILIEGVLEASYPSSTTMLALCVIPVGMMQFERLINNKTLRLLVNIICIIFLVFMVIGRLLSGVHWFTDILGGILLSLALITLYRSLNQLIQKKKAFK